MNNNLALLADFLETTMPPEKFNISNWRRGTSFNTTDEDLLHGCGTTACALGWGALMPELQAQGLAWDPVMMRLSMNGLGVGYETRDRLVPLFDLPVETVTWLFFPCGYWATPELIDVIARMRHVIAGGTPDDYPQ